MDESLDHIQLARIRDTLFFSGNNEFKPLVNFLSYIVDQTGIDVLPKLPNDKIFLNRHEKHVTSQFGEDGIIEKIFEVIGTTDKFYLEFGATGEDDNTTNLRKAHDFTGVLWGNFNNVFVTVENVGDLCKEYNVPREFDFMSIDIDGNDWYIWKEISKYVRPRVVCIEYNGEFLPDDDRLIVYDPEFKWDLKSKYFGASLKAVYTLGRELGYNFVCCNMTGNNAFFIRDDIDVSMFVNVNDYKTMYRSLKSTQTLSGYYEDDPLCRSWLSTKDVL